MNLQTSIVDNHTTLTHWRRDIHANPELAFNEHRTAAFVAEQLKAAGLDVFTGIGGTGVVARLQAGNGDASIGLRADLDALPMQENNEFDYRSGNDGVFHGCGHDGHTVMLLGAALDLAREPLFDGTVYFIFQPAEEGMGGALAMIDDGLFERFRVDRVFGMHNWPGLPAGRFAVCTGPMMAAFEKFDITINGVGGHGAMPHFCIDPVPIAAQIVQGMQSVVSRSIDPLKASVISITQMEAGDAYNVIPETARLSGAIRYLDRDVGTQMHQRMRDICQGTAQAGGASAEISFHEMSYPALVNEAEATRQAALSAAAVVGDANVERNITPVMGSEDFASMLEVRPGCYIFIGNGVDSEGGCMVHHPEYDFNDEILPIGASYWVQLTRDCLPVAGQG